MIQPWPHLQKQMIDKKTESQMQRAIEVITVVRNLRAEMKIPPMQNVKVTIVSKENKIKNLLKEVSPYIINLAKLETLEVCAAQAAHKKGISAIISDLQVFLELEGIIDLDKEIKRLKKEIEGLRASLKSKESRLKNTDFLHKAPIEIVEKEKEALAAGKDKLASLSKIINELKK